MHPALSLGIGALIGTTLLVVTPSSWLFVMNPDAQEAANPTGDRYACPMMDFIGFRPGPCPVCGMKMELVKAGEISREQMSRMGVEIATISKGAATVTVQATGVVGYDHRYTEVVIPRVSGRIVKRHDATFGCCTNVLPNEPVVDLYSPEAFAAQGELQTAVQLKETKLIAAIRERFVRWNLTEVADKIIAGGQPVDTVTITTPVGGQVWLEHIDQTDEDLLVGREIKADQPLIRLVNPQLYTMIVHIPETRAAFIKEGQAVELYSDEHGKIQNIKAQVDRLAREIDPETRTVEVRVYITGSADFMRPGALITARLQGQWRPPNNVKKEQEMGELLIPKSAVLSTGVRHVAWKLDGPSVKGKQKFAPVSLWLGPRIEDAYGNDFYVVRGGLAEGDQVATRGAFLIDSQAQLAGTPSLLYPTGSTQTGAGHVH